MVEGENNPVSVAQNATEQAVSSSDVINSNNDEIQKPIVIDESQGHGHSGVFGTVLNMSCNIMGGGLLVLPLMMERSSAVVGVLLCFLFGFIAMSTAIMNSMASDHMQCFSYRTLVQNVIVLLGKPKAARYVGIGLDICLFLYCFGALVGYCRIIIDSMPSVVIYLFKGNADKIYSKDWFWALVSCLFVFFPLTSLPSLSELKWSSFFGLLTILYVIFLVIIHFFIGDYSEGDNKGPTVASDVQAFYLRYSLFQGIPAIAFSYSCHYNVPVYYKELKDRSPKRYRYVTLILFSSIAFFYAFIGLFGYLMLGDKRVQDTKGNIMNGLYKDALDANIGRLLLFVHFLTTFPVIAISCRNFFNHLLFKTSVRPHWQNIIEAFVLVAISGLLGYFAPGVSIPFSIIGALFGVPDILLIPAISFISAYRDYHKRKLNGFVIDDPRSKNEDYINAPDNTNDKNDGKVGAIIDNEGNTVDNENNVPMEETDNNDDHNIQPSPTTTSPILLNTEMPNASVNCYGSKDFEINPKFNKFLYYLALIYIPFGFILMIICLTVTIYGIAKG